MLETKQVYDDAEAQRLFVELDKIDTRYRTKYQRFGKTVEVPRGQAAYTLTPDIHYNYGRIAAGTPEVRIMDGFMKEITADVNKALGSNFNTILLNKYLDGNDCIGAHSDNENGWAPGTGFATLSFGASRDFVVKSKETGESETIAHCRGLCIHMKHPMNHTHTHAVPKRKRCKETRISLTFRHIVEKNKTPDGISV